MPTSIITLMVDTVSTSVITRMADIVFTSVITPMVDTLPTSFITLMLDIVFTSVITLVVDTVPTSVEAEDGRILFLKIQQRESFLWEEILVPEIKSSKITRAEEGLGKVSILFT